MTWIARPFSEQPSDEAVLLCPALESAWMIVMRWSKKKPRRRPGFETVGRPPTWWQATQEERS